MTERSKSEIRVSTALPNALRYAIIAVSGFLALMAAFEFYSAIRNFSVFSIFFGAITGVGFVIAGRIALGGVLSFDEEWIFRARRIEINAKRGEDTKNTIIFRENIESCDLKTIEYESLPNAYVIELTETNGSRLSSPNFKDYDSAKEALGLFLGRNV